MQSTPLSPPNLLVSERGYILSKNVSAIQILSGQLGERSQLGLMTQLPGGAELEMGGPGFDENTLRVRCAGSYYYIFLEDLEPQRKRAAVATASVG